MTSTCVLKDELHEAMQLTEENREELVVWIMGHEHFPPLGFDDLDPGDWVVRFLYGFRCFSRENFEASYVLVEPKT